MKLLLKNVLFTLIVPGAVGVYVPLLLAVGARPVGAPAVLVSLLLFATAGALYLWAVANFAWRGRGTPLPLDAPKELVIQGPYRYTRNPMYLALFSALLGWIVLFQTLIILLYSLALGTIVRLFVIRYEEPHLRQTFGKAYEDYAAQVPRWIPRFARVDSR